MVFETVTLDEVTYKMNILRKKKTKRLLNIEPWER
jgi:hypothetical protein